MSQSHYFHSVMQSGAWLFLAYVSCRTCRWCGTSAVFSRWFLAAVWSISITFAPSLSLSLYLFGHDAACWSSPPLWRTQWSQSKFKISSCQGWIKHPAITSLHPVGRKVKMSCQMWKASSIIHRFSLHYWRFHSLSLCSLSRHVISPFHYPLFLT